MTLLILDLAAKGCSFVARFLSPEIRRSRRKERRIELTARLLADIPRAPQPGPITLVATFSASTGIATAARRLARALRRSGVQLHTIDVTRDFGLEVIEAWPENPPDDEGGGTLVLCIPPPALDKLISARGVEIFKHRRWAGWWWWELELLPDSWRRIAEQMDEIWCPSRFVYDCFARSTPDRPLHYLPLPVEQPFPSAKKLIDFGLPGGRFTVLSVLDLRSYVARKNPDGMMTSFSLAFGKSVDVLFVLKISGGEKYPSELARLQSIAADSGNIYILTDTLTDGDVAALIQASDLVFSLHRSEGFGMVPAEATLLGTSVVATAWSGVMEFLDPSTAALIGYRFKLVEELDNVSVPAGCRWAEPDLQEAARWLKNLKDNEELRRSMAVAAKKRADMQFHEDVFRRYLISAQIR